MAFENWTKTAYFSRNVAFAALVVIGTIAVYNWFIVPHTSYLGAAQRYELVASKLAKTNRLISNDVKAKKREVKELNERLAKVRTKLFGPAQAEEFFDSIEDVAREMNCRVLSIKFSDSLSSRKEPAADSDITVKSVLLNVAGSYKNVAAMINKLQNRTEQVWIDGVKIKSFNEDLGSLKCDMRIAICVMGDKEASANE